MKINGYRLDTKLKETEFLSVYKATQVALDRSALVKVVKAQFATDEAIFQRLRREALAVAKISHPNVIHVYDFGEDDRQIYIAMEYFPSQNFQQILQTTGPVEPEIAVSALQQVLSGLQTVHDLGIFHRDIKPANLLMNDEYVVKITDFGLANLKGATGVTMEGGIVGTPRYMSPEQISGAAASPASELFSLGVTFYEFLTEVSPFDADSFSAVFNRILNYDPIPAREVRADIPEQLSVTIQKMIARNAEERYQNCKEVLNDLGVGDFHIQNEHDVEENSSSPTAVRTFPVGRRVGKYFIAAILVVLIGAFIVITLGLKFPGSGPRETGTWEAVPIDTSAFSKSETAMKSPEPDIDTSGVTLRKQAATADIIELENFNTLNTDLDDPAEESTPATGNLHIGVIPWGTVYLDADSVGVTPLLDTLSLLAGTHRITITHPEFPVFERTVQIRPGTIESVRVNLLQENGYLALAVYPWAEVYIDGEFYDTTPLPKPLIINPGRHLVQLRHPDYQQWQSYVEIPAGDTANLRVQL